MSQNRELTIMRTWSKKDYINLDLCIYMFYKPLFGIKTHCDLKSRYSDQQINGVLTSRPTFRR